MRILVTEDELRLAEALAQLLQEAGHEVDVANDGPAGLARALEGEYDVLVLDVMLPGLDGFAVARQLRRTGVDSPILMLTAREGVADKVAGLDCGADDYMTKPFAPEELLARIRALGRRRGEPAVLEELAFEDLCLELASRTLRRGERQVQLSPREFDMLRLLMTTPRLTAKRDLIAAVWGESSAGEDNNVEAYISFLRKKLVYLGSEVVITTLRKVGYRLEAGAEHVR